MTRIINLNADLGESFGAYTMGNDGDMLSVVGSANIACGFHGGDPLVMQKTVQDALSKGVSLGAHPSFPDLQGFGRRRMSMSLPEVEAMILYQVGALQAVAHAQGGRVSHVKPHGALNNMACEDPALATAIARAIKALDSKLILLAPALSCLYDAGIAAGLPTASEIFADRAYEDDATLTPRGKKGAVLHDPEACAAQVLSFLENSQIITRNGKRLDTPIHSICVHGDTADAVEIARILREKLTEIGFSLAPLTRCL